MLTNPQTLFELQECILTDGSQYWIDRSVAADDAEAIINRSWHTLRDSIAVLTDPPVARAAEQQSLVAWYRQPLFVSVITAAAVLAAVFLPQHFDPAANNPLVASQGWGWDREGAMNESLPADQYIARLADSADEWFKKTPDTATDVAARIAEFRQGCSTLILASHRPLADDDRTWLVDKCRAWATNLDSHLAAIESGEGVQAVRTAADETIRKLSSALRQRSKEIAARNV